MAVVLSGRRRTWTDEEVFTLRRMSLEGADINAIANALGRSRGSVKNQPLILKRRERLFSPDIIV